MGKKKKKKRFAMAQSYYENAIRIEREKTRFENNAIAHNY